MTADVHGRKVRFAAFEVDLRSCELFKHGLRIKLQDQPFQILAILLEQPGEVIPRDEIRKRLWTEDTFVDFDAGLNAAIRRLRDALSDSAEEPRYIETLPRHGYRFVAPVEVIPESKPDLNARTPGEVLPENGNHESLVILQGKRAPGPNIAVIQPPKSRLNWVAALALAVGLLLVVMLVTRAWRARIFSAHASSGIHSIAVLPLQNLSGDPNQEYFADGMTDALITDLAQTKSLRVISRTSSMRYKGTQKKLSEIAKELNVDAVAEGAVIRSGDRVRIDAQLIRADNDQHLWAKNYDRKISDVLSLQAEVAQAITTEIAIKLSPEDRSRLAARKQVVDPKVYEAYLKGRYFSNRPGMEEGLKKSVAYFQEAIRLDPDYAPAYAGLADAYSFLGFAGVETDPPRQLAIEAAKKATSLDDSLAEAHASLGWVLHRHMQDWTGAEKEYRRAIELDPNSAIAHQFYGVFQRGIGLDKLGCDEHRLAHELDPLNPVITDSWAECVYVAGHFDEAVRMVKDILEVDPNNLRSLWTLGEMYERMGMFPEAIEQYQKGMDATSGKAFIPYSLLASAYAGSGQTEKAEKILREMKQKFGEDDWIFGMIHTRMGQKDRAIRELTEDVAKCGPGTCGPASSLYVNWRFDPLRSDPRVQTLLKRFNYPESAFKK